MKAMKVLIKMMLLSCFVVVIGQTQAQNKVLLVGFTEDNFTTEWKTKAKLAKKNYTTEDMVDDLYRKSLLAAMTKADEECDFLIASDSDVEKFEQFDYKELTNQDGKEYFGVSDYNNKELIDGLLKKYNVDYIVHMTQYKLSLGLAINLHTKIVHRLDYQILNNNSELIYGNKKKVSGVFQGAFRPSGVQINYKNTGKKISRKIAELQGL